MEKFLAVLMAVIMTFSMTVLCASAADEVIELPAVSEESEFAGVVDGATGIYDDLKEGNLEGAVDDLFALIVSVYEAIHKLVGDVMAVLGEACVVCGENHGEVIEDAVVVF